MTRQAQVSAARYDYPQLHEALQAAEKLQQHNTRLIKLIEHTESRLSAVAEEVAQEVRQIGVPSPSRHSGQAQGP